MDVPSTKQNVAAMFNDIAKTYDTLNSILSFGMHHQWRKKPLKWMEKDRAAHYLDLAAGTADQLIAILDEMPHIEKAYAVDPANHMLEIAKKKIKKKNYSYKVDYLVGSADQLPFTDQCFDFSTVTFGIRNFSNLQGGIKELFRVTKPAGQVHIIEFGRPTGFIRPFYSFYRCFILPFVGRLFSHHKFAYSYLDKSIDEFEDAHKVTELLREAGFESVFKESLFFGIINHFIAIR